LALFLVLAGSVWPARAGENSDAMAANFYAPPDSAKPWAYWWWLNGNVSKVGITRDLEEMKRQGINGVLIFHWTIGDLMDEQFWARYGELAHQHAIQIHSETGYRTYPLKAKCLSNRDY